jgi:hypothetical protein
LQIFSGKFPAANSCRRELPRCESLPVQIACRKCHLSRRNAIPRVIWRAIAGPISILASPRFKTGPAHGSGSVPKPFEILLAFLGNGFPLLGVYS